MMMLHMGGDCLNNIVEMEKDAVFKSLIQMNIPKPVSVDVWLRTMGQRGVRQLANVNTRLHQSILADQKEVTGHIDAAFCRGHKKEAHYSYKGEKGYMPMVAHIAESGSVIATEFREGSKSPCS